MGEANESTGCRPAHLGRVTPLQTAPWLQTLEQLGVGGWEGVSVQVTSVLVSLGVETLLRAGSPKKQRRACQSGKPLDTK